MPTTGQMPCPKPAACHSSCPGHGRTCTAGGQPGNPGSPILGGLHPHARLTLRKCHESETDLGVTAVRQPGKPRSHMIDMSRAVRPYKGLIFGCTFSRTAASRLYLCRLIENGW